jgi:branched-chain amino acid transport system ATP-binding protein
MRTIAGVIDQTAGSIVYRGKDITHEAYYLRLRRGIGWAPEGRLIFADLTVEDNLYLSARVAGARKEYAKRHAQVCELFPVLVDRRQQRAGSMSGGEQQMLAIARALIRGPDLVLLDEPSMGLAPSVLLSLGVTVGRMVELGVAVLVADQSVSWLTGLSGSAVFIQGGQVVLSGDLSLIRDRELVQQVYLGHRVGVSGEQDGAQHG